MTSAWTRLPNLLSYGVAVKGISRRIQPLSISAVRQLKDIVHAERDGVLTIEGVYVKSPREEFLLNIPTISQVETESKGVVHSNDDHKKLCPLCKLGPLVRRIKHTDVLILHQFLKPDGSVLPRRVTGLCGHQQRRVTWLVEMAKCAGLIRNTQRKYGWKDFNKYYDDDEVIEGFLTHRRKKA